MWPGCRLPDAADLRRVPDDLEALSSQELFDLAESLGVVFTDAPPLAVVQRRLRRMAYG